MAANNTEPKVCREFLATLIAAKVEGSGKPVQKVYNYLVAKFGSQTPVVVITDDGEEPEATKLGVLSYDTWFYYRVWIFAEYSAVSASYTEKDSENVLGQISKMVYDVLIDNAAKGRNASVPWDLILPAGRALVDILSPEEGISFRRKMIPVKARLVYG